MKWFPLRAAATLAAISLLALTSLRVSADQPSSPTSASSTGEQGVSQSSSTPAPNSNAPKAPSRHATRGEYLARTALTYRGVPYRFGGSSRSGIDCSALVQSVCAKWGLYLPRAAHMQFHVGTPVQFAELQAGDLVFFKNTYKQGISHVGIYIGNNCFVHAAGRGKGVCISRLDSGYHRNHWAGARRLNLSKLPSAPGEEETGIVTPDQVSIQVNPDNPDAVEPASKVPHLSMPDPVH